MTFRALVLQIATASSILVGTLLSVAGPARGADAVELVEANANSVVLKHQGQSLAVSTLCPKLVIAGNAVGGQAAPHGLRGNLASGEPAEGAFAPIPLAGGGQLEINLHLQWSVEEKILRKWASYRLTDRQDSLVLEEVVLDVLETDGSAAPKLRPADEQPIFAFPMSYPVFLDGFFVGIEFPIATTRIEDGRIVLAHTPGLRMQPNVWYDSRKAVYGVTPLGQEKRAFQQYVVNHAPGSTKIFFVWDSWVTVPIPFAEADELATLEAIDENLCRRHGGSLDSFVLDAGWANPKSLWEIDAQRFPHGFAKLHDAARRMNSRLGLWISPSSSYSFTQDNEWGKAQGYETLQPDPKGTRYMCLAGPKYQACFKQRVLEMYRRYEMNYSYYDGYQFTCPETDHGHEPGPLSAEPVAEGLIDVFQAARHQNPDIWLEATCFGGNASPWWLFYVNTVLGNYGDDYPWGRIPTPVYRESQTTGRDQANLQGCRWGILPVACQDVFAGLYNHNAEPFVNDAVQGIMRGNRLYFLCTNPSVLSDYGWAALAQVMAWARTNSEILAQTQALLPRSWQGNQCPRFSYEAPMPREAYGYAHGNGHRAIVALRNPWITPTTYSLRLNDEVDLAPEAAELSAISLFPENRSYGQRLKFGETLEVPLKPYELLVLSLGPEPAPEGLADAAAKPAPEIHVTLRRNEVARLDFENEARLEPDAMSPVGAVPSALKLTLEADVQIASPQAELLILCEDGSELIDPVCRIRVNGQETPARLTGPETGYAAESHPRPEHWLFLRAPLGQGASRIEVELLTRSPSPQLSAWIWATKPGQLDGSPLPNSLPQPELISLDSAALLAPTALTSGSLRSVREPRPIDRIEGRFVDALEPASDSTAFKKNANWNDQPLRINGRRFLRGLGTSSASKIRYSLEGQYRRFQSWAGVDGSAYLDKTVAVFEVWIDGQKRWESGRMTRWDAPVWIDLDVSGGRTLELVVIDQSTPGTWDHSNRVNWGEPRLLH